MFMLDVMANSTLDLLIFQRNIVQTAQERLSTAFQLKYIFRLIMQRGVST